MPVYHTPAGRVEMLEWGAGEELWLLLHAAAAGPNSLSGLAAALAAPGRRIVAPALHLYGQTRIEAAGDRIDHHVAVARACLDILPAARRVVFGHSMGGLVGVLTAMAGASIDRLVLYDPIVVGCLDPDDPQDMACRDWDRAILAKFDALVAAGQVEAGVACFVEAWNEVAWDRLPASARARLIAAAPTLAAEVRDGSHRAMAGAGPGAIGAAMLILQGAASPPITHRMTARLHAMVAGSRRVVLTDCGHMAPVGQPVRVAGAICSALDPTRSPPPVSQP